MNIFPTLTRGLLVLAPALMVFPAVAARLEIQLGRSYMDRHAANVIFAEGVLGTHRLGDSRLSWSPDLSAGWIGGRDLATYQHARYGTAAPVWLVAAGIRLHAGDRGDGYRRFFFSFQPALHRGRTQTLSSCYEFVSTLGWQGRRVSVQVRHISNGGLHDPNRGETMALLGIAFDP